MDCQMQTMTNDGVQMDDDDVLVSMGMQMMSQMWMFQSKIHHPWSVRTRALRVVMEVVAAGGYYYRHRRRDFV
jgi:hypothetical protein